MTKLIAVLTLGAFGPLFATNASAHDRLRGPLPTELVSHRDDIEYLKRHAGLDTQDRAKGLFGLHYYYAEDAEARELTLKLLNSNDTAAQMAALRIISHCGGYNDQDVAIRLISRLETLSSSKRVVIRTSAFDAARSLLRREKNIAKRDRLNRILKRPTQSSTRTEGRP